jgi:hypothetical protein
MENTPPSWIEIVDLPPKFSDIVIAKIRPHGNIFTNSVEGDLKGN